MPEQDEKWNQALSQVLEQRETRLQGDRSGLERLMSKLEAEGLLRDGRVDAWRRATPLAMAASVVTVALVAGLFMFDRADPLVPAEQVRYRGFGTELSVVVSQPDAWVLETERALARVGCASQRADGPGLVLTVDAAPPCIEPLNRRLWGTGITVNEPGRYRLVLSPAS